MNQTEVAKRLGMTQTNYSFIETGKTKNLSFGVIDGLGEIFGKDGNTIIEAEKRFLEQNRE